MRAVNYREAALAIVISLMGMVGITGWVKSCVIQMLQARSVAPTGAFLRYYLQYSLCNSSSICLLPRTHP